MWSKLLVIALKEMLIPLASELKRGTLRRFSPHPSVSPVNKRLRRFSSPHPSVSPLLGEMSKDEAFFSRGIEGGGERSKD